MILEGKVALITGASRGLGKEISNLFRKEGAYVIGCSSSGGNRTEKCDVSDYYEVNSFVGDILNNQNIDIVVCNAGIYGPIGPLEETDLKEWMEAISVNLFGVVNVCRSVIPYMKKTKRNTGWEYTDKKTGKQVISDKTKAMWLMAAELEPYAVIKGKRFNFYSERRNT